MYQVGFCAFKSPFIRDGMWIATTFKNLRETHSFPCRLFCHRRLPEKIVNPTFRRQGRGTLKDRFDVDSRPAANVSKREHRKYPWLKQLLKWAEKISFVYSYLNHGVRYSDDLASDIMSRFAPVLLSLRITSLKSTVSRRFKKKKLL